MPTTGEVAGKLIRLQLSGDDGVTYTKVGCTTEDGYSTDSETDDSACKDDGGWRKTTVTTQGFEITLTGFVIYDSSLLNFYDLLAYKEAATELFFKYGTEVVGDTVITGKAVITDISQTGSLDGKAVFDVTMMGVGQPGTEVNA